MGFGYAFFFRYTRVYLYPKKYNYTTKRYNYTQKGIVVVSRHACGR